MISRRSDWLEPDDPEMCACGCGRPSDEEYEFNGRLYSSECVASGLEVFQCAEPNCLELYDSNEEYPYLNEDGERICWRCHHLAQGGVVGEYQLMEAE